MALLADHPLFLTTKGPITPTSLADQLRAIGIAEGDVVMAHTELLRCGRIPTDLLRRREDLFDTVIDTVLQVIGLSGTLVMPTLTTKCLSTHRFELLNTPSETGVLTEHFRRRAGVLRTPHPTHSMAVVGAVSESFLHPPAHPFGEGSAFHLLRQMNGKLLFLGADFHWCTFVHHIETMAEVPYRKAVPVMIHGVLPVPGGRVEERTMRVFRFQRPDRYWPDFERFRSRAVARGILRESKLGNGYLAAVSAEALYREGRAFLEEDRHAFLRTQPWPKYILTKAKRLARKINDRLPRGLRPLR